MGKPFLLYVLGLKEKMPDVANDASGGHIISSENGYTQFKLAAPIPHHPCCPLYKSPDTSAGQASFSIQMSNAKEKQSSVSDISTSAGKMLSTLI